MDVSPVTTKTHLIACVSEGANPSATIVDILEVVQSVEYVPESVSLPTVILPLAVVEVTDVAVLVSSISEQDPQIIKTLPTKIIRNFFFIISPLV
tara:strand:+ start:21 stop:305 length:285 start_codon:yes stop_codon:yes gene_type:complete